MNTKKIYCKVYCLMCSTDQGEQKEIWYSNLCTFALKIEYATVLVESLKYEAAAKAHNLL